MSISQTIPWGFQEPELPTNAFISVGKSGPSRISLALERALNIGIICLSAFLHFLFPFCPFSPPPLVFLFPLLLLLLLLLTRLPLRPGFIPPDVPLGRLTSLNLRKFPFLKNLWSDF